MATLKQQLITSKENSNFHYLNTGSGKPIKFIGNAYIKDGFEETCLQQAANTNNAPGVEEVVVNPDAHSGYGAPVGCVVKTSDYIYPGPVGYDIKCSMSHLQLDLPEEEIQDKRVRRSLINAIEKRIPTGIGKGQRSVPKSRHMTVELGWHSVLFGAEEILCNELGIPSNWPCRCEDASHGNTWLEMENTINRLEHAFRDKLISKFDQLGSYGGGNHFLSCDITRINPEQVNIAEKFGLRNGCVSVLSHCGSRGFGHLLASDQFSSLEKFFTKWNIPYPGGDKQLVYAPLDSLEGEDYLNCMYMGANFATVNHLLINTLILEAFKEVFPGVKGDLVYFISHNIAREEIIDGKKCWIHRKGATRAYPAEHFSLKNTPFYETGHPILLPGNVTDGSVIMVANEGAKNSLYSVNHGAGRQMGRKQAYRELNQSEINKQIDESGIITNCRNYPMDESKGVYKDFNQVIDSVSKAGLATTVAKLEPRFVLKDEDK